MGFETFFYRNKHDTLFCWMQNHFPAFADWVNEQVASVGQEQAISTNSEIVELVNAINGQLPNEEEFRQRFSYLQAAELVTSMFYQYGDSINDDRFDLPELAYFCNNLQYHHIGQLHNIFDRVIKNIDVASILDAGFERIFIDEKNDARDKKKVNLQLSFWSAEECQILRQSLGCLFDQNLESYQIHYEKVRKYFLFNEDICYDSPEKSHQDVRETASKLFYTLENLQLNEGVVIHFSY